jgi:hypothetical protein
MGSGLHSALIQDPSMVRAGVWPSPLPMYPFPAGVRNAPFQTQGKHDNSVYDHGHPAFQRKQDRAPFEPVAPWPRGANDPLFPEPETAVSKAFNGGAARCERP